MALAATKPKIEKDKFGPDGVRLFNPTKPHGVVYADGYSEVKYIQEWEGRETHYRGDGFPVGYTPGKPLPKPVDQVEAENETLKAQVAVLTDSNARTLKLLEQIQAQLAQQAGEKEPAKPAGAPASGGSAKTK